MAILKQVFLPESALELNYIRNKTTTNMYHHLLRITKFLFFLLVGSTASSAQNLIVKNVSLQPNDLSAIEKPCFDQNGDTCALLKIKTDNLEGIEFSNPNQYIKTRYSAGIYYVYVPAISKKLDLGHKDYMPLQIDMSDYGYKRLRKGKTYLVVIDAPKKTDLKSSVIIKIEPKQAQIIFDGQTSGINQSGTYEFSIAPGNHLYEISAPNYHSQKGSINIGRSEAKTISVHLQPITHEVVIGSNVEGARVFIDNIDYGKVGKLLVPQGTHTIRVQADGYVDMERNVTVNSSVTPLSFILKKNKRTTHIHATPVRIYAPKSAHIYKNNKKIEEWRNGAVIMFMPGKYMLSDDFGNTKKITVGSEPMTVNM